jgi:hypothetical protein
MNDLITALALFGLPFVAAIGVLIYVLNWDKKSKKQEEPKTA